MFTNYFRIAFRNIKRNKIYSFINIAGLSLGLASAMLIILYIKDEVSYDRFHKDVDHTYLLGRKIVNPDGSINGTDGYTGLFQGPKFAAAIPGIKSFVRVISGQKDIKTGTDIRSQQVYYVDTNFFSAFTFPLLSGNPATVLQDPNSVVISEELANKQFGSASAMGKIMLLKEGDGFKSYVVSGVAKKCPQNSSIKFQALLPLQVSKEEEQNNETWLNFYLNTFVILDPHANAKEVEAKIKNVYATEAKEAMAIMLNKYGSKWTPVFSLLPLAELHLSQDYRTYELSDASNPAFSYILAGIALFILMIACINFINLTIARSVKRAKEIGVRKVVGGDRKQLVTQFLGESLLICFVAFLSAILVVLAVLPAFNALSNKVLSITYLLDIKLVAGYIVLFLVTSLLAGFYPALVLSSYDPVQTLYSRFALKGKNYLQKSLVVFQFSLASFLIIATLTIVSQFNYLTTQKLGYDDGDLVVINQWGIMPDKVKLFREELMKDPNVAGVAPKNTDWSNRSAKVNGEKEIGFGYETIDESYLPLLNVPIVQGRNFSEEFAGDSTGSVLVNEAFVKEAGWTNPIGQVVDFWYDSARYAVVGVVKDYHFHPLSETIKPQLFVRKAGKGGYGSLYIKLKAGQVAASLAHIEQTFKRVFPLSPYSYVFKDQQNFKSYESEVRWKQMLLFATTLTIFISCIGLFGLSVSSAEKRIKEIGIRKVLGASVSSVVTVLSADFLKLILIALVVSMPLAWMATGKWLQTYPYRIVLSWWMFAGAGLMVITLALLTVSFQAIKAAIANPVRSLRTE